MNPFPSLHDDLHIYIGKGQLYLSSWTQGPIPSPPHKHQISSYFCLPNLSQVCLLPLSSGQTTKSLPLDYRGGLQATISLC